MVVVGIIGILVSIAGPQFNRYQRKARQSEAKIALSAVYSLEKSFYSEYSAYIPSFDAIGYSPEGSRRFYMILAGASADLGTPWGGTVTGYSGSTGTTWYNMANSPYPYTWTATTNCAWSPSAINTYGNDPQNFDSQAIGNLCANCNVDAWHINQLKVLANCGSGL